MYIESEEFHGERPKSNRKLRVKSQTKTTIQKAIFKKSVNNESDRKVQSLYSHVPKFEIPVKERKIAIPPIAIHKPDLFKIPSPTERREI